MNEQKNPIPQEQQYLLTAGTPPAEPLDIPPLVALSREEARSILTRGFASVERIATAHGMLAALLGTYYALRRVEAQRDHSSQEYGRIYNALEVEKGRSARWEKLYEKELVNGREWAEQHEEELKKLRSENASLRAGNFKLVRKPRRKGGRK